jgi:hypothetical protein
MNRYAMGLFYAGDGNPARIQYHRIEDLEEDLPRAKGDKIEPTKA